MSVYTKLEVVTNVYDLLHHWWEHPKTQRKIALLIFVIYVISLISIELNRNALLPENIAKLIPVNHFYAINVAFTLILGLELMSLILTLSCSISRSLGKQLEILAMILLRDAFKVLSHLPEPVDLSDNPEPILHIIVMGTAALFIFACKGLYTKMRADQQLYISDPLERMRYVMSKKLIALLLFIVFFVTAIHDSYMYIHVGETLPFFETIYTILIFSDIALVLISQRFMPNFYAVFRNSGFVVATLIMRLSLSVNWPWNAITSVCAGIYILALTWLTLYFKPARVSTPKTKNMRKKI